MLFDHFAGSYALMGVAFFEVFAVIYVYGWQKLVIYKQFYFLCQKNSDGFKIFPILFF